MDPQRRFFTAFLCVIALSCKDQYRSEIEEVVEEMHEAGIHGIPVLVFEVEGVAKGPWVEDPRASSENMDVPPQLLAQASKKFPGCKGREINHGSGTKKDFKAILKRLHQVSMAA